VSAAFFCYLIWGLVPLYWKELAAVDALELIAHRHVWSLVFLVGILAWRGGYAEAGAALGSGRGLALSAVSSVLLTANWLIYIWGVNAGHVIECSLGYFLVPLLNVTLGKLVLHESLRRLQGMAVIAAAAGVAILVLRLGHVPWIALGIAGTFGFYGLLRKRSALGPVTGLAVETAVLAPFAAGWLIWKAAHGQGALGHVDMPTTLLVLSTGVVTAIPLLLFAYGARRLRLITLGLLQYIAPTCQFLLGWLVYREVFTRERAWAFVLIWFGLVLYTTDAWLTQKKSPRS